MKKFLTLLATLALVGAFAAPAFAQEVDPGDEEPAVTEWCVNGQQAPVQVAFTGDGFETEYYEISAATAEFLYWIYDGATVAYSGFNNEIASIAPTAAQLEPGSSILTFTPGPCPAPGAKTYVPAPTRALYCAGAGNTNPFTGEPIRQGSSLDLLIGQPDTDSHYAGATPAAFVRNADGTGYLTCNAAGFTATGNHVDSLGNNDGSPGAIYPEHK